MPHAIFRLGKDHLFCAATLQNLAELYSSLGKYKQAKQYYIKMQNIIEKNHEDNEVHPDVATALTHLGDFYTKFGKYKKAAPLLLKAWEIRKNIPNGNKLDIAVSLEKLAKLSKIQGDYLKAEEYAQVMHHSAICLFGLIMTS